MMSSSLEAGRTALSRGDWQAARLAVDASLQTDEQPETLEGLALAAWWLDLAGVVFDARERALALRSGIFALLDEGDPDEAERLASDAVRIGEALGAVDYEMVGRALHGFAAVRGRRIASAGIARPRERDVRPRRFQRGRGSRGASPAPSAGDQPHRARRRARAHGAGHIDGRCKMTGSGEACPTTRW